MINFDIRVLLSLPEGAALFIGDGRVQLALANRTRYYRCPSCNGWLQGEPGTHFEHESGILCGRRGRVYQCRRCSHELGFDGCYF